MIRPESVLKTSVRDVLKMSWRCLEDVFKTSQRRPEDVLKTSWRRLEDVLKTSSKRLEDVLKTSWKHLEDVLKMSWGRLEDVLKTTYDQGEYIGYNQDVLKTSSEDEDERRLQDVFKTSLSRRMFAGIFFFHILCYYFISLQTSWITSFSFIYCFHCLYANNRHLSLS